MTIASILHIVFTTAVLMLGSECYQKRERAERILRIGLPHSLPYLYQARAADDPEVHHRAVRVIVSYRQRIAPIRAGILRPAGYPYLPWIDQLPSDWPDRNWHIKYWLQEARDRYPKHGMHDSGWKLYRLATKLYIKDLLTQPNGEEVVQNLLNRMRDREVRWIREKAARYGNMIPPKLLRIAADSQP